MGLSITLYDAIAERAADALILSLQCEKDILDPKKREERIQNIHARNRVLSALEQEAEKDPNIAELIKGKIRSLKKFYKQLGGERENASKQLGCFALVQKMIEAGIPSSILLSLKPDSVCSSKELQKKQEDKETQKLILKKAAEKAKQNPAVEGHLLELFSLFEIESSIETWKFD